MGAVGHQAFASGAFEIRAFGSDAVADALENALHETLVNHFRDALSEQRDTTPAVTAEVLEILDLPYSSLPTVGDASLEEDMVHSSAVGDAEEEQQVTVPQEVLQDVECPESQNVGAAVQSLCQMVPSFSHKLSTHTSLNLPITHSLLKRSKLQETITHHVRHKAGMKRKKGEAVVTLHR